MADRDLDELHGGLEAIRGAPTDAGTVELLVSRPAVDRRRILREADLDERSGLVGDTWAQRPSSSSTDGGPHPDAQVTVMSARAIATIAGARWHWPLAGDQLFVDLDLSETNLPAGTRLAVGSAVLEVTAKPHTGCAKFSRRFGADALRFVNSPVGRELRLRGLNARVVQSGTVKLGDRIAKVGDRVGHRVP